MDAGGGSSARAERRPATSSLLALSSSSPSRAPYAKVPVGPDGDLREEDEGGAGGIEDAGASGHASGVVEMSELQQPGSVSVEFNPTEPW